MTKDNRRVLILTSTYPRWAHDSTPGFVADFAENIARSGAVVHVLAPHYQGAARHESTGAVDVWRYRYFLPDSAETIAYNGGAVSKIKKTPLYGLKLLCFLAMQFCWALGLTLSRRISIINAHWLVPQGFIGVFVTFLTGRKLAITVHGGDVLSLNGGLMRKIKRFTLRHADVVYVNSSVTRAACEALYARHYVTVPMGIDVSRYGNVQPSSQIKKQYALGDFTILFVGRLSKEKGVIYLLEALKLLQADGIKFTALIVGTGPLEQVLHAYIDAQHLEDCVTMVGWVDAADLPRYYATADVLVGPSLYEAQGLVFLEALASGLPVITSYNGGMKDFMTDGENGFLVAPASAQAIYEKLALLSGDRVLLHAMAARASHVVTTRYSWQTVTKRYLASWNKLL